MMLTGAIGDDRRRCGQCETLHREQIDEIEHAALGKHRKRHQQQDRCEQVDELGVERDVLHRHQPPRSWCTSMASTARGNAVPRNSGARKMRILALRVSMRASANPPTASLATRTGVAPRTSSQSWLPEAMPNGMNNAKPMHA